MYYCYTCFACTDCFGCVGLKNKQYCILNKQYTKEEYQELVGKIIENMIRDGEWGEYLAPENSPWGYNETMANLYFPLEKQEAIELGYQWNDYEALVQKRRNISLLHLFQRISPTSQTIY